MNNLILTPAYGRDYKTAKEARQAWDDNKDFVVANVVGVYGRWSGKYCSKRTIETAEVDPPDQIEIRFKHLANFIIINK